MYNVFTRTWWRRNKSWPDGLEPCIGRKTYLHRKVASEERARELCKVYNDNNDPGPLSRKAEYEGVRV